MTAKATILKISTNRVTLRYCEDSGCGSCGACSKPIDKKETILEAVNRSGSALKEGDLVEVFLSPWKAVKAGFMVLILPLILFIVAYMAGEGLLAIKSEAIKILFGLFGVALGFLINLFYRIVKKEPDLPEIIGVVHPASG
ncbi:MAG TPA: SoxR reducing system RseC family protein [Spirochaetia bacterium]|nr:SoxR reducing system RseC family protein [Spirochaetia bacterium]